MLLAINLNTVSYNLNTVSYNLNDVCYDLDALCIFSLTAGVLAKLLIGIKSIIQTYVGDRK